MSLTQSLSLVGLIVLPSTTSVRSKASTTLLKGSHTSRDSGKSVEGEDETRCQEKSGCIFSCPPSRLHVYSSAQLKLVQLTTVHLNLAQLKFLRSTPTERHKCPTFDSSLHVRTSGHNSIIVSSVRQRGLLDPSHVSTDPYRRSYRGSYPGLRWSPK